MMEPDLEGLAFSFSFSRVIQSDKKHKLVKLEGIVA
jgi:hypothetical protein